MDTFRPMMFIGSTPEEAAAKLEAAIADGSFPVVKLPIQMWMTAPAIIPGAMQQSSYELHVLAWVEAP